MPKFSEISTRRLEESNFLLIKLFSEVIKTYDCVVLCGYRNEQSQELLYRLEKTQKRYPQSKHNQQPSWAVDVAPYPIDWGDRERFYHFGGYVQGVAARLGIPIRWGGDWDGDRDLHDQQLYDLIHFELI